MTSNRYERVRGFSLVELVVVIAIIAVLTAVIIPSFNRFIDQSRFSNDTQSAQGMSTILKNHMVSESYGDLDAQDVRNIIDFYNGSPYDFSPQAKDTGFFYISGVNSIIAAKFDEVEGVVQALSLFDETTVLDVPVENENVLPEQLFHQNSHLLSFEGSAVAEIVKFVGTMANQGSAIETAYSEVVGTVEDLSTNPVVRLFGFGLDQNIKDEVLNMLAVFDPSTTLFVNNVTWVTTATSTSDIERIVFTPGISNIPTFSLPLELGDTEIILTDLVIPRTVKTIQTNAFPEDKFEIAQATIKQGVTVSLESDAFPSETTIEQRQVLVFSPDTLTDYSYYVRKTENGYDLSALREFITEEITGYNVFTSGQYYEILIYTSSGLVGFARNIYTINYYYNYGDLGLYRTERTLESIFSNPVIRLVRPDANFVFWNTNPCGGDLTLMEDGETELILNGHPYYVWNVYAIWTDTSCS
jgi:prepilin-type N-terminal cleavage/methylation domain-containing protein